MGHFHCCRVPGWPLRSLNPGRDAAATLLRRKCGGPAADQPGRGGAAGGDDGGGEAGWEGVEVVSAEHHSRQAQDWCVGHLESDTSQMP